MHHHLAPACPLPFCPIHPPTPCSLPPLPVASAVAGGGSSSSGGGGAGDVSIRPPRPLMDAGEVHEGPPPAERPSDGEENGVDDHPAGGYLLDGLDADGELAAASVLRPEILDSVVKVYATHCEPNFSLPWQRRRQVQSTSSGFIISTPKGRRILTNAHSVEYYTVVQVKKRGSDVKFQCTVLAIAHECDLALMTVEDEAFWADTKPLLPGGLPMLQDAIVIIGYPIGGDTVSVTAGVVSRLEMMPYSHGQAELLGVQVDSAINPGNSGGPAFNDQRQVVGVAFQGLAPAEAEAIGYIIPWVVVSHFLDDVERHGRYTGFCYAGFEWSKVGAGRRREQRAGWREGCMGGWCSRPSAGGDEVRVEGRQKVRLQSEFVRFVLLGNAVWVLRAARPSIFLTWESADTRALYVYPRSCFLYFFLFSLFPLDSWRTRI